MHSATLIFWFLFVAHTYLAAQTTVPKGVKSVDSIEDIGVGMPGDLVIAGLTKQGYTLKAPMEGKGNTFDLTIWQVWFKDKQIGEFIVEKGRVTSAELLVYDSNNSVPGDGPIELAEALYWILFDNGRALASKNRDWTQTETGAHFTTRDTGQRTPGFTYRQIFATMANGASYRIALVRTPDDRPLVQVSKLAPFVKTK